MSNSPITPTQTFMAVAMLATALVSCTSDEISERSTVQSAPTTSLAATTTATAGQRTQTPTASPTTPPAITTTSSSVTKYQPGDLVASGSIGPPLISPRPWPVGEIGINDNSKVYLVRLGPVPNPDCVAAQATVVVGRGGALLVSLFVEGDEQASEAPCPDSATTLAIPVDINIPADDLVFYVDKSVEFPEAAPVEALADQIIGLPTVDAIRLVEAAGYEVRDLTDVSEVNSDENFHRINIETIDGAIRYAWVY